MTTHRQNTPRTQPSGADDPWTKEQAVATAQAGKDAAGALASTATDAAKDVAQQTSAQAHDLLAKTKTQLTEQVSSQQAAIVESLRSLGEQLTEMTEHVEHDGTAVDLAAQARDRVRGAADWLDGRDPADVLDELRKLGRNRPGAFLLGATVAGVLAGRLTRGVVAVHADDAGGAATPAATDSPVHAESAPPGYAAPADHGSPLTYGSDAAVPR